MNHPFVQNLGDKSTDELQEVITELNKKLNWARQRGNADMARQINMALDSYREEHSIKMTKLLEKMYASASGSGR